MFDTGLGDAVTQGAGTNVVFNPGANPGSIHVEPGTYLFTYGADPTPFLLPANLITQVGLFNATTATNIPQTFVNVPLININALDLTGTGSTSKVITFAAPSDIYLRYQTAAALTFADPASSDEVYWWLNVVQIQ